MSAGHVTLSHSSCSSPSRSSSRTFTIAISSLFLRAYLPRKLPHQSRVHVCLSPRILPLPSPNPWPLLLVRISSTNGSTFSSHCPLFVSSSSAQLNDAIRYCNPWKKTLQPAWPTLTASHGRALPDPISFSFFSRFSNSNPFSLVSHNMFILKEYIIRISIYTRNTNALHSFTHIELPMLPSPLSPPHLNPIPYIRVRVCVCATRKLLYESFSRYQLTSSFPVFISFISLLSYISTHNTYPSTHARTRVHAHAYQRRFPCTGQ